MIARALIAEDESLLAQGLRADLCRFWPELRVDNLASDGKLALELALTFTPEICFLDIHMPGLSGLEVAQALAEDWPSDGPCFPLLVFITAHDDYALEAFAAQAVDYLLKPVQPERLQSCVQRLQRLLAQRTAQSGRDELQQMVAQLHGVLGNVRMPEQLCAEPLQVIQAAVGNTVYVVPVDEVVYFEAADKYVRVVTSSREHLIRVSLRELLPRLDPQRFWQVHRSAVVQIRLVETAYREETGKVTLTLRGRSERIVASRLYAHLFRGM